MTDENTINALRNKLENKLTEKGYKYDDTSYKKKDNINVYKTYTESEKDPYVYEQQDVYAKYEEKSFEKPQIRICPKCETPAMYVCNCEKAEVMCKNHHIWWFQHDGTLVLGDPHENEED